MTTFCLLIFSRNTNEEVLKIVNSLKGDVEEIVIIDSSDDRSYLNLRNELDGVAKIYRTVPMGITDTFRAYADSKITSDYVLNLDCDEEATDPLKRDFRMFDEEAAYLVGWHHLDLEENAKKLVLYRKDSVRWIGHVFEYPVVTGRTVDISNRYQILHHADFGLEYLRQANRRDRYFLLESILRPPTREMLSRTLHQQSREDSLLKKLDFLPAGTIWRMAIWITYFKRLIENRDQKNTARFLLKYGLERMSYFARLSAAQKILFSQICEDIYSNGGLIHYLSFDNPECVDLLSSTFNWQDNSDIMMSPKMLIMYRYLNGKSLRSFYDFPYTKRQLATFWNEGVTPGKTGDCLSLKG